MMSKHLKETTQGREDGSDDVSALLRRAETELPGILNDEMISAGSQNRRLNTPKENAADGSVRGQWEGPFFVLNDEFVPKKLNKSNQTFGQIKKELSEKYGIHVDRIPYVDEVADFSSISLVTIPTDEIVTKASGITKEKYEELSQTEKTALFQEVFSNGENEKKSDMRSRNFRCADEIAAEKQIPVPGLKSGYSAADLESWRSEYGFTWDEQVKGGYLLVPSVIHGNLAHTGLVSTSKNANSFLRQREQDIQEHPEDYSWDEQSAPISIDELNRYGGSIRKKQKGVKKMAKKMVLSRGMNIERAEEYGPDELPAETENKFSEWITIQELGEQFNADKGKLEDAIERIKNANIAQKDKDALIAEVETKLSELQKQYEEEVENERKKVQQAIEENLGKIGQSIDELKEQSEYLNSIEMKGADVDLSAAKEKADEQASELEQKKAKFDNDLLTKISEAEEQLRSIRTKRQSK